MAVLLLMIATLTVLTLAGLELRTALFDLAWVADRTREDQLDEDFAWWVRARRSPLLAERMAARQVLTDLFDYTPVR